jgi:hypothetical protein
MTQKCPSLREGHFGWLYAAENPSSEYGFCSPPLTGSPRRGILVTRETNREGPIGPRSQKTSAAQTIMSALVRVHDKHGGH